MCFGRGSGQNRGGQPLTRDKAKGEQNHVSTFNSLLMRSSVSKGSEVRIVIKQVDVYLEG